MHRRSLHWRRAAAGCVLLSAVSCRSQSLRRATTTPGTFEFTLERGIHDPVPKRLDESHVCATEQATWFDVDRHLRLVGAVIAVDPRKVHDTVDCLIGNLCGELARRAVQRDKR